MVAHDLAQQAENFFLNILPTVAQLITRARQEGIDPQEKSDRSLLTKADLAVDHFLLEALQSHFPEYQIVTEESSQVTLTEVKDKKIFVDPIDETSEFVRGGKDFGTLIGIVEQNVPVAGAIFFPDHDLLLYALPDRGAWSKDLASGDIRQLRLAAGLLEQFTAVQERDDMIEPFLPVTLKSRVHYVPQTNLRGLTDVILGKTFGHIYAFRGGPWDIAGPQAIAQALGLQVKHVDGTVINYQTTDLKQIHQRPIIFTQSAVTL